MSFTLEGLARFLIDLVICQEYGSVEAVLMLGVAVIQYCVANPDILLKPTISVSLISLHLAYTPDGSSKSSQLSP